MSRLIEQLEIESQRQLERLHDEIRDMAYQASQEENEVDFGRLAELLQKAGLSAEDFERLVETATQRAEIRAKQALKPNIEKEAKEFQKRLNELETELQRQRDIIEAEARPLRDRVRQLNAELRAMSSEAESLGQAPTLFLRQAFRAAEVRLSRLEASWRSCPEWKVSSLMKEIDDTKAEQEAIIEQIRNW